MAQIPFRLMRETDTDGQETCLPAKEHPLYKLMDCRPNPWQTAYEFREMMSWHVELTGNFIAFKNAPLGVVRELIPFQPAQVAVIREDDLTLHYRITSQSGSVMDFPAEAIWHVRGPSWNSWMGIDWLTSAREAIGLSLATEESQARMHKNGVRPTGMYSVDGKLNAQQYKDLRAWLEREVTGLDNGGKPVLLDSGAKFTSTQMTGVDAQHLETRRHQIEEICRFFGVMPIMVGHNDKSATYASAEQMFLAHAMHCLAPRWERYECSANANLLTEKDRSAGLYFDFEEEGMIRGSARDTKDVILGYVNGGILTPNEGRDMLDKNPDPDPASNELRIPVNVAQEPAHSDPLDAGDIGDPAA